MEEDDFDRSRRPKKGNFLNDFEDERKKQDEVQQIKINLINFAKSAWGQRWIRSTLSIGRPFRMERGIQYAIDERRIENFTINKGQIFATVQGTAPTPYRVKIILPTISEEGWTIIVLKMGDKIINLIRLLEGVLTDEVVGAFDQAGFSLFPDLEKEGGLNADCSCPDKEVPCKHIAAVILYLARVIDFKPFILFELRGKTKDELLKIFQILQSDSLEYEEQKTGVKSNQKEEMQVNFNVPKISAQDAYNSQFSSLDLSKIGFQFKKRGRTIETLENLGLPSNLENPKAFASVFDGIYKTVMDSAYKLSMENENTQKQK